MQYVLLVMRLVTRELHNRSQVVSICFSSETGGMYFGPQEEGKMKQLAETMLQQKIVHEVLTSEEANKRISILNLPRGYYCILEPKAGIIRASMAVQSYQVGRAMSSHSK